MLRDLFDSAEYLDKFGNHLELSLERFNSYANEHGLDAGIHKALIRYYGTVFEFAAHAFRTYNRGRTGIGPTGLYHWQADQDNSNIMESNESQQPIE